MGFTQISTLSMLYTHSSGNSVQIRMYWSTGHTVTYSMISFLFSLSLSSSLYLISAHEVNCGHTIPCGGMTKERFSAYVCPWICSYCYFTLTLVIISYEFHQSPVGSFIRRLILKLLASLAIVLSVFTWK